ncbi:MAG: hypothetical protein HY776_02670 [Actinobacteria bacterium]|nr:hypothetical protein [Actinomycetota bacterium]
MAEPLPNADLPYEEDTEGREEFEVKLEEECKKVIQDKIINALRDISLCTGSIKLERGRKELYIVVRVDGQDVDKLKETKIKYSLPEFDRRRTVN